MNKLLLGATALLVGGIYSAPASASAIELSVGGEAELTTIFGGGICNAAATAAGITYDAGDIKTAIATLSSTAKTNLDHGSLTIGGKDLDSTDDAAFTFNVDPCGGKSIKSPTFEMGREISFGASGTLANGLEVSFDDKMKLDGTANGDDWELKLGGAFGEVLFRIGGKSAAADMLAGTTGSDAKILGGGNSAHYENTSGTGDVNITYYTPSMGGIDLAIGYNPSADGADATAGVTLDDGSYDDTFSIGFGYEMAMGASTLTLGGGMESASTDTACATEDAAATDETAATVVE